LFRLFQEPGRLWKRYLRSNPRFIILALRELLRGES
jgi:N-acetylglucosaminyldiphosphoundecaprenol N-acetyl-beta-D-mannosaminyltransferase